MDALLATIRKSPPTRAGFHKLLQAIQSNLALEGSELLFDVDLLLRGKNAIGVNLSLGAAALRADL